VTIHYVVLVRFSRIDIAILQDEFTVIDSLFPSLYSHSAAVLRLVLALQTRLSLKRICYIVSACTTSTDVICIEDSFYNSSTVREISFDNSMTF